MINSERHPGRHTGSNFTRETPRKIQGETLRDFPGELLSKFRKGRGGRKIVRDSGIPQEAPWKKYREELLKKVLIKSCQEL